MDDKRLCDKCGNLRVRETAIAKLVDTGHQVLNWRWWCDCGRHGDWEAVQLSYIPIKTLWLIENGKPTHAESVSYASDK